MSNNELSIIQFHTIPRTLPSQVLIIELSQLPNRESHLSRNEIYSWGNMNLELESANYLFAWPITSELINLQPHFAGWYERARTQCGTQSLEQQAMENNDIIVGQRKLSTSSCACHRPSPYNEHQLWLLQKAFLYSFNLFLDKTSTLSHWSYGLSSIGSSLTHAERTKMINYAKYDVMAVTYLIRPITEQWSFTRTKESSIEETFITFQSTRPPPLRQPKSKKKIKNINVQKLSKIFTSINDSDYELISSEDEIYLNQLIEPVVNVHHPGDQINNDDMAQDIIRDLDDDVELQIEVPTTDVIMDDNNDDEVESVDNHIVVVNEEVNTPEHQQQRVRKKRSFETKQKKNRKRNMQLRVTRFTYYFTRPYYSKFKSKIIKKDLHHYGVQFRHIKFSYDQVVIGVKTNAARRDYEETLPYNCFNRRNYWRFRR
ncbi:unnamed protein product [Rotaria sordida]|uniref:Uncharacterized protein n=1 Tax=Rotaria sordida TaxID=392033 RepID=A0A815NCF5_9BILA|nr:unnamed protein product [Rotaria sordida]CAF1633965.1 unnamed protein product [Rotaria sordida]